MTLVPLINISIYVFVNTMLIPSLSLVFDSLRLAPIKNFDFINKRKTWPAILISNYFSTALVLATAFIFILTIHFWLNYRSFQISNGTTESCNSLGLVLSTIPN